MEKRPTNDEKEFDEYTNNFQGKPSAKVVRKKPKDEKIVQEQENHKKEQVMSEKLIERNSDIYKEPKKFEVKQVPLKHTIFLGKKNLNLKSKPKETKIEEKYKEPDLKYEQFYSAVSGQRVFEYQQMNEMIKKKQEIKEVQKLILFGMNDKNITVVSTSFECLNSYIKVKGIDEFKNIGLFDRFSFVLNEELFPVQDFIFETILLFCKDKEYINEMINSFKFLEAINHYDNYKIKIFLKMIEVNSSVIPELLKRTNIDYYCKQLLNKEMYIFLNELIKNGYCLDIINDLFENIFKSKNGYILIQTFIEYHYDLYDFKPFIKELISKKEYSIDVLKMITSLMKKDKNFKVKIEDIDLKNDIEYIKTYYEYLIYLEDSELIKKHENDDLLKVEDKWYNIFYIKLFKKNIKSLVYNTMQLMDSKDIYIFYHLSKYLPKSISEYLIQNETWNQKDWLYTPIEYYYQNHSLVDVSIPLVIDVLNYVLFLEENKIDFKIPKWIRFINVLKIFLIQDIFMNPDVNQLLKEIFKYYENDLVIDNYDLFFTFFENFITNYISNSFLDESWNLYLLPFLQIHFPSKFRLLLFKELKNYVNRLNPPKENILYFKEQEKSHELLSIYSDILSHIDDLNPNLKNYLIFHTSK